MTKAVRIILPFALLFSLGITSCETDLNNDPSFQAWCGDTLCDWMTEAGQIARVGTWHPNDYGVELVETPTVLSQDLEAGTSELVPRSVWPVGLELPEETCAESGGIYFPEAGLCFLEDICTSQGGVFSPDTGACVYGEAACTTADGLYLPDTNECFLPRDPTTSCKRFEVTADIEDTAQVNLEIDYGADGTVDHTQPIVASRFEPVSFLTSVPNTVGSVRFRIHKRGDGRAVLARFGVRGALGCIDDPVLTEVPRSGFCNADSECAAGVCADVGSWQACGECDEDADCGAGNSCQVVLEETPPTRAYRACRAVP